MGSNVRIEVRAAVVADAVAVGGLLEKAWRTHYAAILPAAFWESVTADAFVDGVRTHLTTPDPSRRALVAHSSAGDVVGWVVVGPSRSAQAGVPVAREVEVYQLYVDRPGTGLGRRLMDTALPRDAGAELWVFAENVAAQRFYHRHGFQSDGCRHTYRPDLGGGVPEIRLVR